MAIKKITSYLGINLICILGFFSSYSLALKPFLPSDGGQADLNTYTRVNGNEETTNQLIQIVNEYLRFFVGFVVLILLAYAGVKIITAEGNKEQIKKGYDLLIAAGIVIFVSILSYAIVQLLVNIF